jgi:gamma-butyrobetaine dioxygenase
MKILESLLKNGIVIVADTPREEGTVLNFSRELLGSVRETHWGIVFDVKASPPKEGVSHDLGIIAFLTKAYSGEEIEFNVDNPYRTPCIDYQLLHCIKSNVVEGQGLNRFVDAIGCAEKLKMEDPLAFETLASTPVKWENDYPHMTISPMVFLFI